MTSLAYLNDRPHSVYVMWAADVAVYVGMTSDWDQRMKEHGVWWYSADPHRAWNMHEGYSLPITHVDVWELGVDRSTARAIERQTIGALTPTHNRTGASRRPSRPFDEVVAEAERHRLARPVRRRRAS